MKTNNRKTKIATARFQEVNAELILPFLVIVTALLVPFVTLAELLAGRYL